MTYGEGTVTPHGAPETTLTRPRGEWALIWLGFPLAGAVLGWLLPRLAEWLVGFDWLPLPGPVELAANLPELPAAIGGAVLGIVGGVVLALMSESEYVTVTVRDDELRTVRDNRPRTVERANVDAVFVDGKDLVVVGPDAREVLRQGGDLPDRERLRAALEEHGFPWMEEDPHAEEYRRWVDGLPELSTSANALLKARAKALENDKADDAEELRSELVALDVMLRDRDGKQHFRVVR
ncbi:hypothetical protein J4H86_17275 [Spiractinospora alimapuensis]|uniref:YqeB family protein n=1 Tax=Spiractinospora alimapuensis TaxID=2820884 RepID=UPI001F40AA36|nr:hypothetical protein [Spiractinospora alimapuensis]QVQ50644.1 hypothetical protein J4H86_17275 [Spiractinospora alimapuensis]